MPESDRAIIDWSAFNRARTELGTDFVRILGYFREDGVKALTGIDRAMAERSAAMLVLPAHTLKGDAAQLGAKPLSELAERVEIAARECVEHHQSPTRVLSDVMRLRPLFEQSLAMLEQAASPPVARRPTGFGRKTVFGRG